MRTPPDLQVRSILVFLREALKSDKEILQETGARPEEIVASIAEYQPIQRDDGKNWVLVSMLPCLALNVESSIPKHFGSPRRGRVFTASLWYIFNTFQSEGKDIHGLTKTERFKSLINWKITHYLRYCQIPIGVDNPTIDLSTLAKIRTLKQMGTDYFNVGSLQGIKTTIEVAHLFAPYTEVTPAMFELLDLTITEDAGAGLSVEADIDV